MKKLIVLLSLLVAAPALGVKGKNKASRPITAITAATLGASRSFEVENVMQGGTGSTWGLLMVWVSVTDADDSETGVSLACTASTDNNTTDWRIPACVWDSVNTRYNCEAGPLFWNPTDETSGGTKRQLFRYDVEGIEDLECTFTFTGGSASDTLDVAYSFAMKG